MLLFRKEENMKAQLINSQLTSFNAYEMNKRQLLALAENVFKFKGLNEFIDISFLNSTLLRKGSIAFFQDDVMGLLALPYRSGSTLDVYGRPIEIDIVAKNGYNRHLTKNEFVIMYDNNGRYPLWLDILQYSERIATIQRTIDINIDNQKTPRIWKTSNENVVTLQKLLNEIDGFSEKVVGYDGLEDLTDTTIVLEPAPFITDKLQEQKEKLFNEFLRLIGIANLTVQKKERSIKDEIQASQGGTIASRFNRFEPRKQAIEEINKKFGTNIEVSFYDDLPTTIQEFEQSEVTENEL